MRVLQVVTTPRSFFDQQVDALERAGVDCETVAVPRREAGGRTPLDYLRFYRRVLDRARAGFDLVHANCGSVAPFALAQPVRPVVVTFWGSDLMGDETPAERAVRRASLLAARLADAVVLPSRAMAAHLDREYAYVPFGVDRRRFRPIPQAFARERVGWRQDERVVLFPYDPGRPEKDYDRARAVVDAAGADATLRTLTGAPYDEMPYYLNASDAVLVTSRRESGPMVVKEAVACGIPVVSTDVGFVREVLDDVPGGGVADSTPGLVRALEAALGDDGSAAEPDGGRPVARFVRGNRRVVADPEETAARLVRVYEGVLDGREGAR